MNLNYVTFNFYVTIKNIVFFFEQRATIQGLNSLYQLLDY